MREAEGLCDQALEFFEAGELDKAEELWLKAAELGSDLAYRNLGMNAKESKDLDLAIERFGHALALGDSECARTLLELVSERISQLDLPQGLNRESLARLVRITSLAGRGPGETPDSPNLEKTLWASQLVEVLLSTDVGENERSRIGVLATALNIGWPEYPKFEGNWNAVEWLTCTLAELGSTLSAEELGFWSDQQNVVPSGLDFIWLGALVNPEITTDLLRLIINSSPDCFPLLAMAAANPRTPPELVKPVVVTDDTNESEWILILITGSEGWPNPDWERAYGEISPRVTQSAEFWRVLLSKDASETAPIADALNGSGYDDNDLRGCLGQLGALIGSDASIRQLAVDSGWAPAVELASDTAIPSICAAESG